MARAQFSKFAAFVVVVPVAIMGWLALRERDLARVPVESLKTLEHELESLRSRLRIPGMSAAIAEGTNIIWTSGFGMANHERSIAAGPDTIYHLASMTKPFASVIVLQLADEGRLSLDDPVSRFGITMERSAPVRV